MTGHVRAGEPVTPRPGYLRLVVAAFATCLLAQAAWAVGDLIVAGRAVLEPGAADLVDAVVFVLLLGAIPSILFNLPVVALIALVTGCVALASERLSSRVLRTLAAALGVVAAAAATGAFTSVEFSSGTTPVGAWSLETALAFAAFGALAAVPLAPWATHQPTAATGGRVSVAG